MPIKPALWNVGILSWPHPVNATGDIDSMFLAESLERLIAAAVGHPDMMNATSGGCLARVSGTTPVCTRTSCSAISNTCQRIGGVIYCHGTSLDGCAP